jgi:hypothetical protein
MSQIHFLDVTSRDGGQTAFTGLSEVPYLRAQIALAEAGALGDLRPSGWCHAVPDDVAKAGGAGTIGGDTPNRIRERLARLAAAVGMAGSCAFGSKGAHAITHVGASAC